MPSIFETDAKLDLLAATAIAHTKELMAQSDKLRDRREKANRKRVARLFKDPKAIEATITLTDEVMRISSIKSSWNRLTHHRGHFQCATRPSCCTRSPTSSLTL